jgi:hypothetical protein
MQITIEDPMDGSFTCQPNELHVVLFLIGCEVVGCELGSLGVRPSM